MINGAHVVIYSKDPDVDRTFFRDALKFPFVDAGRGWLIFALPPAEAAFHDSEENGRHELYFTCDDIATTVKELKSKKVRVSPVTEQSWGKLATLALPGGGEIGVSRQLERNTKKSLLESRLERSRWRDGRPDL